MNVEYRGYTICTVEAELPTIELVEVATGTVLPTKIVGTLDESMGDLAARARQLCDMYAADLPGRKRSGSVRGPAFEAHPNR